MYVWKLLSFKPAVSWVFYAFLTIRNIIGPSWAMAAMAQAAWFSSQMLWNFCTSDFPSKDAESLRATLQGFGKMLNFSSLGRWLKMFEMCFQSGKSGNRHCCTVATWQLQSFDKSLQLAKGLLHESVESKTLAFCKLPMPMQSLPIFFEWFKLVQVGSSWFKHKNICFNHQPTNIANVCTCSMYHPSLSHCHGCHEIFPGHVLHPSRGPSWRGLLQHLSLHRFWSSTRNLGALGSGDLYVNLKLSDEHPDCDWCFSKDNEDRRHQHGFLMLGG